MGIRETLQKNFSSIQKSQGNDPFISFLDESIQKGGMEAVHARTVRDAIVNARENSFDPNSALSVFAANAQNSTSSVGGLVGINDYGVKGKRQYIAERRRLLDLYVIAYNVVDIRTAITHLRNEIFRRGIEWKPKFDFKCDTCGREYSKQEAKKNKGICKYDQSRLREPDDTEVDKFKEFFRQCNYFQQSLEQVLKEVEDDINIVDDAFLYMRKQFLINDWDVE